MNLVQPTSAYHLAAQGTASRPKKHTQFTMAGGVKRGRLLPCKGGGKLLVLYVFLLNFILLILDVYRKNEPKETNRLSPNESHASIHTPKVQNTLRRFNLWLLLCECVSSRKCLNISAFSPPYAGPPPTTSAQNGALNAPPGAWPNLYHHGSHEPMTVSPQAAGNSRSQMSGVFVSLGYPHHGLL